MNRVFRATGGGAESYSIRIVQELAQRHDIHVVAQEFSHEWPGVMHVKVPRLFKRPRWLNQLWYALCSWHVTRHGFDVVHSHENTWHGDIQTIHVRPVRGDLLGASRGWARAGRWAKIAASPRLLSNLALEAMRFRVRRGRRIVLVSDALRAQCVASYPDSEAAMSVITPGVDMGAVAATQGASRAALGLPEEGEVILFVGNDFARKGLGTLLEAVAGLPSSATLAVVGSGSGTPYQDRIRALGLEGRVLFLGVRQDMGPLYRAATVLAHPTLGDSFAMVVLEAMAQGLPVVASGPAHCGISTMLRDGGDALLLDDPRQAGPLRDALGRILDDRELAARLSRNGLQFAAGHSWRAAALAYEALYAGAAAAAG
nr:glycosyltransferase family 4 protein [Caenimonas aquaedulcis]